MSAQQLTGSFALCIEDGDLEARKLYQGLSARRVSRDPAGDELRAMLAADGLKPAAHG